MFSVARQRNQQGASFPHESAYGFMVVDQEGRIEVANGTAITIVQMFSDHNLNQDSVLGEKLSDIIGPNYEHTLIGSCVNNQESLHGKYLIGNQLYLVMIDKIEEDDRLHYEAFYFPVREGEDRGKGEPVFQNMAYEAAKEKGYMDIDWIKTISDEHAKQLVDCLNKQQHTIHHGPYCPFRRECAFNEVYGWMELERRSYYRISVNMDGVIHLLALKGKEVPQSVSSKKIPCTAQDISLGGVKLQSSLRIPVESTLKMVFEAFSCSGTVRWIEEQGDQWLHGVQFADLNARQRRDIIKVINANRVRLTHPKSNHKSTHPPQSVPR
ncbi:MAG: PilZ domain-containing protein [Firmicutes bacterium]|jgi:hypothetical protein|nr:PilZ domain-containing protein [Bacillota bacterium]